MRSKSVTTAAAAPTPPLHTYEKKPERRTHVKEEEE